MPILSIIDTYHDMKNVGDILKEYRRFIDRRVSNIVRDQRSSPYRDQITALLGQIDTGPQLSFTVGGVLFSIEKYLTNLIERSTHFPDMGESRMGHPAVPLVPYNFKELQSNTAALDEIRDSFSCVINYGRKSFKTSFIGLMDRFFSIGGVPPTFIIDRSVIPAEWFTRGRTPAIIRTGASYYDGSPKYGVYSPLNTSVSKTTGELFYLDNISTQDNVLYINDKKYEKHNLNSSGWKHCMPNVGKTESAIRSFMRDKYTCYSPDHCCSDASDFTNFVLDLKRAGDALQVKSCLHLRDTHNSVFVTHDTLACTHARMLGLNVLYTHIDPDRNRMLYCFKTTHNNKDLLKLRFNQEFSHLRRFMDYIISSKPVNDAEYEKYITGMNRITRVLNIEIPNLLDRLKSSSSVKVKSIMSCFIVEVIYVKIAYNNFMLFFDKLYKFISVKENFEGWYALITLPDHQRHQNLNKVRDALSYIGKYQEQYSISNLISKHQLHFYSTFMTEQFIPELAKFLDENKTFDDSNISRIERFLTSISRGQNSENQILDTEPYINAIRHTMHFKGFFKWVVDSVKSTLVKINLLSRPDNDDPYEVLQMRLSELLSVPEIGKAYNPDQQNKKQKVRRGGGTPNPNDLCNKQDILIQYFFHTNPVKLVSYLMYLTYIHPLTSKDRIIMEFKITEQTDVSVLNNMLSNALISTHPGMSLLEIGTLYSEKSEDILKQNPKPSPRVSVPGTKRKRQTPKPSSHSHSASPRPSTPKRKNYTNK
jgi:hypothetical protein